VKYQFEFLPSARRQLMAIEQHEALRILTCLARLGDDPYREDADVKKLAGSDNLYRLRVGNYRVAYQIDNGRLVILVVKVAHRREIYRGL
jgi:mRNA interferase RelE/StbE